MTPEEIYIGRLEAPGEAPEYGYIHFIDGNGNKGHYLPLSLNHLSSYLAHATVGYTGRVPTFHNGIPAEILKERGLDGIFPVMDPLFKSELSHMVSLSQDPGKILGFFDVNPLPEILPISRHSRFTDWSADTCTIDP